MSDLSFLCPANAPHQLRRPAFDDSGFLFDIQGLTDADNHMMNSSMSEDTSPAINATLRIQVGTTTWYIPLSDTKDCS